MMVPNVHLPDGQTFTAAPVFGGVGFKSHDMNTHPHAFPIGWTTVLNTEEKLDGGWGPEYRGRVDEDYARDCDDSGDDFRGQAVSRMPKPKKRIKPFSKPTLNSDAIFISSISSPSNSDFKPATSPTRQIAMMLWVTLYWYFHQPEPSPYLMTEDSKNTPINGRPKGEWTINIKRDGLFRGRNLIPKLERMGLIASMDTTVGTAYDDACEGWKDMFITRRMFWQTPARLFLFTLQPMKALASLPGSPASSRPNSPTRTDLAQGHNRQSQSHSPHPSHSHGRPISDISGSSLPAGGMASPSFPISPFYSTSHLPTYYPPAPLVYTCTNGIRHPLRPKPPRMGETFYTRFVPSVGQYLSFRVASIAPAPLPHLGPVSHKAPEHTHLCTMSDTSLLQMWMASPRVKPFWGEYTPNFLTNALNSAHSFPAIGCWDGVPFGYFEIYWVKEDILGQHVGDDAAAFDRGLHVMIGEEWARGRVPIWLGGLIHWSLSADLRTMNMCMEPRVDNVKFVDKLQQNGFGKVKEVRFPHKQSWFLRLQRESWEGPAL